MLPVDAQTQPSTSASRDEIDERILNFFDALRKGSSTTAFDYLLRGSPLNAPENSEKLSALRSLVDDLRDQFGGIHVSEKLETKRIGTNITVARYVLMYDHYPVVWTFVFYRKPPTTTDTTSPATDVWVPVQLNYETNIMNLL